MLGVGLNFWTASRRGGAGPSYSAEAQQFFTRLSSQPSAGRKTLYANLINSLVSTGVWSKLDGLYLFAAVDDATALTNLKQATFNATAVNTPTFTADQGFAGGSSQYVSSNFNPTTAVSAKYQRDDASIFAWSLTSAGIDAGTIGSVGTTAKAFDLTPRWTDNVWYSGINSSIEQTPASGVTDGSGFRALSRIVSTEFKNYSAASLIATSPDTSAPLANETLAFLRYTSLQNSYSGTVAGGGFGGGITATDEANLYAAFHTYLQAVAGVL